MLLNFKNNLTECNLIYKFTTRFNTKTIKFRHKYKWMPNLKFDFSRYIKKNHILYKKSQFRAKKAIVWAHFWPFSLAILAFLRLALLSWLFFVPRDEKCAAARRCTLSLWPHVLKKSDRGDVWAPERVADYPNRLYHSNISLEMTILPLFHDNFSLSPYFYTDRIFQEKLPWNSR